MIMGFLLACCFVFTVCCGYVFALAVSCVFVYLLLESCIGACRWVCLWAWFVFRLALW